MYYEPTASSSTVHVDDAEANEPVPFAGEWALDDGAVDACDILLGPTGCLLAAPRRRSTTRQRSPQRSHANDRSHTARPPVVELVLYTSAASARSLRAMRAVREVLSRFDRSQVRFEVVDLSQSPDRGDEDAVVFTPTLVKRGPGPRTYIVGNLDDPNLVVDLLELHGVRRRIDGLG